MILIISQASVFKKRWFTIGKQNERMIEILEEVRDKKMI